MCAQVGRPGYPGPGARIRKCGRSGPSGEADSEGLGLGKAGLPCARPAPEPRGPAAERLWEEGEGRTGKAAALGRAPLRWPPQQVGAQRAGGGARLEAEPRPQQQRALGGAGGGHCRCRSRSGSRERCCPGARGSSRSSGAGTGLAERAGAATADKGAARAWPPHSRALP